MSFVRGVGDDCEARVDRLIAEVQACRRCASMEGRRRVLSGANGSVWARVMFIAEAPGRRGGEVTECRSAGT
jgi:uracil-DNA glycosylase